MAALKPAVSQGFIRQQASRFPIENDSRIMLTKLSLAAGLSKAFEDVMPEKFQQSDTTAYAAILDQENHLSFSPSAFYDEDHSLGPLPTAPVATANNARIIGYFSAIQLACFTTEELAEQITDDQIPFS